MECEEFRLVAEYGKKARASLIYFTDLETRIPSGTVCP